jgi:predicted ester cyclase
MKYHRKDSLIRSFIERVWNQASEAALCELTTPDYLYTFGAHPPRDRLAMAALLRDLHVAFPDWNVEIRDLIVEGDRGAARWEASATHLGPFRGVAPTGKAARAFGINVYHFRGDLISAEFETMDTIGLLVQLGAIPSQ